MAQHANRGPGGLFRSRNDTSPPVLVLAAMFLPAAALHLLTRDFLDLKRKYFPGLAGGTRHDLDDMHPEVKGADLRRAIRSGGRNQRRQALGFLDGALDTLDA